MAIVTFDSGVKQIRGKSGNINFAQTKYGIEYKSNPIRVKPQSPAQLAQQARLKRAAGAYGALTSAQNALWQTYSKSIFVNSNNGEDVNPSAYAAFVGLFSKFVQVTPAGTFPAAPPSAVFGGDSVTVTATGVDGVITFTASKANAANVTTELLIQPLRNIFRKPTPNYTSKGFFTFITGTLTVPAGAYSVAIRFVNSATGQEVGKVVLATVNTA